MLCSKIWGSIVLIAMAIMALMISLQWRIRTLIFNRRARGAATA
jgi:hypothetical protein